MSKLPIYLTLLFLTVELGVSKRSLSAEPERDIPAYQSLLRRLQSGSILRLLDDSAPELRRLPPGEAAEFRHAAQLQAADFLRLLSRSNTWSPGMNASKGDTYAWAGMCELAAPPIIGRCQERAAALRQPGTLITYQTSYVAPRLVPASGTVIVQIPRLHVFGGDDLTSALATRHGLRDGQLRIAFGASSPRPDWAATVTRRSNAEVTLTQLPGSRGLEQFEGFRPEVTIALRAYASDLSRTPDVVQVEGHNLVISTIPAKLLAVWVNDTTTGHISYAWISDDGESLWRETRDAEMCVPEEGKPWQAFSALQISSNPEVGPLNHTELHSALCKQPADPPARYWHLPSFLTAALDAGKISDPHLADLARLILHRPQLGQPGPLSAWLNEVYLLALAPLSHRRLVTSDTCVLDLRPDGTSDLLGSAYGTAAALAANGKSGVALVDDFALTRRPAWVVLGPTGVEGTLALSDAFQDPTHAWVQQIYLAGETPVAILSGLDKDRQPTTVHIDLLRRLPIPPLVPSRWPLVLASDCPKLPPLESSRFSASAAALQSALYKSSELPLALKLVLAEKTDEWLQRHCRTDDPAPECDALKGGDSSLFAKLVSSSKVDEGTIAQLHAIGATSAAVELLAVTSDAIMRSAGIRAFTSSGSFLYNRLRSYASAVEPSVISSLAATCDRGNVFEKKRCTDRQTVLSGNVVGSLIEFDTPADRLGYDFSRRSFLVKVYPAAVVDGKAFFVAIDSGVTIRESRSLRKGGYCNDGPHALKVGDECVLLSNGLQVEVPMPDEPSAESVVAERALATVIMRLDSLPSLTGAGTVIVSGSLLALRVRLGNFTRFAVTSLGREALYQASSIPVLFTNDDGSLAAIAPRAPQAALPLPGMMEALSTLGGSIGLLLSPDDASVLSSALDPSATTLLDAVTTVHWRSATRPSDKSQSGALPELTCESLQALGLPAAERPPCAPLHLRMLGSQIATDETGNALLLSGGFPWVFLSADELRSFHPVDVASEVLWFAGAPTRLTLYRWSRSSGLKWGRKTLSAPPDLAVSGILVPKGGRTPIEVSVQFQGTKKTLLFDSSTLDFERVK